MPRYNSVLWFVGNMIAFQVCWWSLVLYGDKALPLALSLLLVHLFFCSERRHEFILIATIGFWGFTLDNTLAYASVWIFENDFFPAPLWLAGIWLCFGATVRHSFRPLWNKKSLLPLLGAFGGVSSYTAAHKLGAVNFGFDLMSTGLICASIWALVLPLIVYSAEKYEPE